MNITFLINEVWSSPGSFKCQNQALFTSYPGHSFSKCNSHYLLRSIKADRYTLVSIHVREYLCASLPWYIISYFIFKIHFSWNPKHLRPSVFWRILEVTQAILIMKFRAEVSFLFLLVITDKTWLLNIFSWTFQYWKLSSQFSD